MANFNGCEIPEELSFDVENHVWLRFESDGTVTMGMTDVAQTMAGKLLYVRPKAVGTTVVKGKSVATIESGKYVGPMRTSLSGTIVAINEEITTKAVLSNSDPYGKGWVIKLKPTNLEVEKGALVTGEAAVQAYTAKIREQKIECKRNTE